VSFSRYLHLISATGQIRTATFEDREHIVVPVVALVEGVIHAVNADNPELVLAEEFGRSPLGWNGRPVMPDHPEAFGIRVSANSPKVLEKQRFGQVFNTKVEGKRLLMEAWLDPSRAEAIGATRHLERVRAGEMLEVSVGVFVVAEEKLGVHNGQKYSAVWREIVPDHLALLPEGTTGACSIKMGCGTPRAASRHFVIRDESIIRVAEEDPSDEHLLEMIRDSRVAAFDKAAYMREYNRKKKGGASPSKGGVIEGGPGRGKTFTTKKPAKGPLPVYVGPGTIAGKPIKGMPGMKDVKMKGASAVEEEVETDPRWWRETLEDYRFAEGLSDGDVRNRLEMALRASEPGFLGVDAVFGEEKKVVYATMPEDKLMLFRRGFEMDDEDDVKLDKNREEVKPVTRYEAAEAAPSEGTPRAACGCSGATTRQPPAGGGGVSVDQALKDRIAAAVKTGKTPFKEEDVDLLSTRLNAEQVTALEAGAGIKAAGAPEEKKPEPPKLTREQVLEAFPDMKEALEEREATRAAKRTELMAAMKSTNQEVYSEDELKAMDLKALEKVVRVAQAGQKKEPVDHSGRAAARTEPTDANAAPKPPDMMERIRVAAGKKSA
jgi:hypothetical protein